MANSTTNLDTISSSQFQKEMTANAIFDAESPSSAFGRHDSASTALTWGYLGGSLWVDGVLTQVANGTLSLTASSTNYIERTRAGVVSSNTTGFTAGRVPLYSAVTDTSAVTSYTDYRITETHYTGYVTFAMADANKTLTAAQAACDILEPTGALTALRDIIVPLAPQKWIVTASVTGGFGVRVKGATGTGITIADGKTAIVYGNGTNIIRASADV